MEKNFLITLGRQFGSGGRTIGKNIASSLNIPYYDKELINIASKESGISGEFFEKADEKPAGGILKSLAMGFSMNSMVYQTNDYLSNESLFRIQSDVIRKIASDGSCIIVGRCADYILRENKNCLRIFISADEEDRIKRVMEYCNIDKNEAVDRIIKADKSRSNYYNYYTDRVWGAASTYDLCINSSKLGLEATTQFIIDMINKML